MRSSAGLFLARFWVICPALSGFRLAQGLRGYGGYDGAHSLRSIEWVTPGAQAPPARHCQGPGECALRAQAPAGRGRRCRSSGRRPAAATEFQTIVGNWGVIFPILRVTTGVSYHLDAVAPCRSLGGFCRAPQLLVSEILRKS